MFFHSFVLLFFCLHLVLFGRYALVGPSSAVGAVDPAVPASPSHYLRHQLVLGPALNVTVREGDKALLPCIAPYLGDKTVEYTLFTS